MMFKMFFTVDRANSKLQFLFAPQKPWLVAYNELDSSDRPSTHRPRGQPLIFVPGDTDGDLIASKVIQSGAILSWHANRGFLRIHRIARSMYVFCFLHNTSCDLAHRFSLLCQGISIDGFRVLLSVHTKERGYPGREGLVFEVYNAETSASSILHLSASHLLKQASKVSCSVLSWQLCFSGETVPGYARTPLTKYSRGVFFSSCLTW